MNSYQVRGGSAADLWKQLVGHHKKLSSNNRVLNAVLVISIGFLIPSTLVNLLTLLIAPLIINLVLITIVCIIYYYSRFKKKYKAGLLVYAFCSYGALATTFFYNAGINGPALFLFFLTFHLLIAISPKKQHLIWTITHMVMGFLLMSADFFYPQLIQAKYPNYESRFLDLSFTYVISLLFVYLITIHLRLNYEKEKNTAKKRAKMMKLRSVIISRQNDQLKKIAWLQSHKVRGQVATILGLAELIDFENPSEYSSMEAIKGIKSATEELDNVIREIDSLTRD